jgi:hypothetical protein
MKFPFKENITSDEHGSY